MMQTVIVGAIVLLAALYVAWYWMPPSARAGLSRRGATLARRAGARSEHALRVEVALRAAPGCAACDSCGGCGSPGSPPRANGAEPAERPITLVPRR